MSFSDDLADLARRLRPRGAKARAVMVCPVASGSGASTVASGLANLYARLSARPVWLFDLDFAGNGQAARSPLRAERFDAGADGFWRCEPAGAGRLVVRQRARGPIFVSVFEHRPDTVTGLRLRSAPAYWSRVREACGLVLVDAPAFSPAIAPVASDMDGVILVADARTTSRDAADALQARIEESGSRVLGIVVNRAGAQRSAA
ncbi:MAG: hypothetical protein AAFX09_01710 [Pseudomonadota bacterium]